MSGENKTVEKLLRYVNTDFSSGMAYLKAGINNILYTLVSNMATEVIVESDINGFLLSELIEKSCSEVEPLVCDSNYIVFNVQDKCISVICDSNKLKFQIVNGKSDN